ncbi:MAG: hypothetical protein OT477_06040 [Chloroflexi bacterium]|nr:hypothetical protein [Chloroflexota bacterium]
MILATIDNRIKWNLKFVEHHVVVAQLHSPWWRKSCHLSIGETKYDLYRQRFLAGKFLLERDGEIIGSATKDWTYGGRFTVNIKGKNYEFYAKWPYGWSLLHSPRLFLYHENEKAGSVFAKDGLSKVIFIDLPDEIGLEGKGFLTWLWVVIYKRALFGIP